MHAQQQTRGKKPHPYRDEISIFEPTLDRAAFTANVSTPKAAYPQNLSDSMHL